MVRDYELMYIARPDLDEEGLQGAVSSVEQLITSAGGAVVTTTSWGRRRLAYEVDHLRDGHYMLLHVRLDGARVAGVERALAIHETVFRHLLVVREVPKEPEQAEDSEATPETGDESATGRSAAPRQTPVAGGDEDAGAAGGAGATPQEAAGATSAGDGDEDDDGDEEDGEDVDRDEDEEEN